MTNQPTTPSDMARLLIAATDHDRPDEAADAVSDEHLLLLATGRLAELPPSDQMRLLSQVAADPDSAELLKELRAHHIEELQDSTQPSQPRQPSQPQGPYLFRRVLGFTLTAAACALISLGIWRLADPPAPFVPSSDGGISILSHRGQTNQDEPDYWARLDQQQRQDRLQRDQLRDWALIAMSCTSLVLAIGLVVTRRRLPSSESGREKI